MPKKTGQPGFPIACKCHGLPEPTSEFVFAAPRKWRFDWAWPAAKIALEIEGGAWIGGRHTRGKGYIADLEKYNAAATLGWLLVRATPQMVISGEVFEWLKVAFGARDKQ